jgi:hypothetical protein
MRQHPDEGQTEAHFVECLNMESRRGCEWKGELE